MSWNVRGGRQRGCHELGGAGGGGGRRRRGWIACCGIVGDRWPRCTGLARCSSNGAHPYEAIPELPLGMDRMCTPHTAETQSRSGTGAEAEARAETRAETRAEAEAETRAETRADTRAETRAEACQLVWGARQLGWCHVSGRGCRVLGWRHDWTIFGGSRCGSRRGSFLTSGGSAYAVRDVHPPPEGDLLICESMHLVYLRANLVGTRRTMGIAPETLTSEPAVGLADAWWRNTSGSCGPYAPWFAVRRR